MISLCVVGKPLDTLNPLSNSMQDPKCDLVRASEHAIALHEALLQKRDDALYYDEIWEAAVTLTNQPKCGSRSSKNSWAPTTSK